MIAIKRLQSIFWILLVAFGALTAYLISLRVATERNAVHLVEQRVAAVRADIRYLETEFEARASMRQLERWNATDYRYGAPQASQYLPDERALASLDRVPANGEIYVAPPVMMAMADADETPVAAQVASPAPAQIRQGEVMLRAASAAPSRSPAIKPALASASVTLPAAMPRSTRPTDENGVARKAARMAMLDAKLLDASLLDDRTLRDLGAAAAAENRGKAAH